MQPIIELDAIYFQYIHNDQNSTKTKILNNLSLSINSGQLTCLLGANGAGKTTLINLTLGRLTLQQGTIKRFGKIQSAYSVKHRISAMLQHSTAPDKATVKELLTLFASYYPAPEPLTQLIAQLNLSSIIDHQFKSLSGGQKQLALLALAMVSNPDVLFLDEPSVGMDVSARRVLWQAIEQYKARGKTIILTTHYLEEADALADRIVVLQHGTIVEDGTPAELKSRFNSQIIKAKSSLTIEEIQRLPSVEHACVCGQYVEVTTSNASVTLKQWLVLEMPSQLNVTNTSLEQAFIQITNKQSPILEHVA